MHDVCDANRGDVTRRLLAIRIGGKHRPAQLVDVGRCRAGLVVVVEKLTFNPACMYTNTCECIQVKIVYTWIVSICS